MVNKSTAIGGLFVCTFLVIILLIPLVAATAPHVTTNGISPMPSLQRID
ncbi:MULTISPECIES: hypothetical protein [Rhizobium]|jgi:hypothetical protein|nr:MULTISPECIES: hypothetical protein [Rhizobium]